MKNKILILFDVDGTLTKPRENEFEEIHFFEIYSHPRVKGNSITDANPETTLQFLEDLFGVALS